MSDTNSDDEQILLVVHKHWATFLGGALLTLVPGFIILWFLFLFSGFSTTLADASIHAIVTFLVPLCFLILWTILAIQWTNYYLDILVVTDRHIFYTTQVNFMERSIQQWNIPDVRNVSVRFGNIVETFLDYGSLEIDTREGEGLVKIFGIPDPGYISAVILKQDDRYGTLKETARKQQELLAFLSHEVKGHLAKSKAAFAAIVEGDFGAVSAPLDSLAHKALADSQQGVDTVMSILDGSDISHGSIRFEKKSFDLSSTVRRALESFRARIEGKGLALVTFIDPSCTLEGDEEKIEQHVLRNFLENAIRYTPTGHIEVSLSATSSVARLCVADTGMGIVASDMQKLFTQGGMGEHSKEVNPESTGYGLFVAKQVVEAHGGRIWAHSDGPGSGSHFFAEFPLG